MKASRFAAVLSLAFALATTAAQPTAAHGWPTWLGGTKPAAVTHLEPPAEHLARFQVSLTNALGLQPHQVCVLHHNLLAQTEAPLPGETPALAPALHEALAPVLRPEQLARLAALPAQASFSLELRTLGVRP